MNADGMAERREHETNDVNMKPEEMTVAGLEGSHLGHITKAICLKSDGQEKLG
jgi:hypothetical protein